MYLLFFPLSSYNTYMIKNVHEYTGKYIYQFITPSNKQQKCFYHSQYITVSFTSLYFYTLAYRQLVTTVAMTTVTMHNHCYKWHSLEQCRLRRHWITHLLQTSNQTFTINILGMYVLLNHYGHSLIYENGA